MDCWRICYLAVFQYAVPRKSFTRKFSSLRKSLIEILTQKNLLIEVLNFFLKKPHIPKVAELTATKNELILVLPYLGKQSFEIRNRIYCCLKKNTPVFNLKVDVQPKKWLSTLFTFKEKIKKVLHSNLVYKFQCNIFNDIYYGKKKTPFQSKSQLAI